MTATGRTFDQFLQETQADDAALATLLTSIATVCSTIAKDVRQSALNGIGGISGSTNIQGEDQKPLDIISNDHFMNICGKTPHLAALVSEEVEDAVWLKTPEAGDFILYFDPLDGSSNLDVNVTVGSIFSIIRVQNDGDRDILKAGHEQICAGFAAYGPSTMLVLTTGQQVDGFTLDDNKAEFIQTHSGIKIQETTSEFAINTARQRFWDEPIASYVADCLAGSEGPRGKDFNMRWVGSMVADVHRILMRGGVFIYPVDSKTRAKGGRLRLMYETNPMAMIVTAAGGKASTGTTLMTDVQPQELHQRVPVVLGSKEEVEAVERYFIQK